MNKFSGPFHYSQIMNFMICWKRGYFEHVAGIQRGPVTLNMFWGSVYHRIVEHLQSNTFTNFEDIINQVEIEEDRGVAWFNRGADIAEWLPDAKAIIDNYWSKDYNKKAHILHSEICFRVNVGPFPFIGRIDELRLENGQLHLYDYKSGAVPDSQTFRDLDYQLSLYAYACAYGEFWHPIRDASGKILRNEQGNYIEPTDPTAFFKVGNIPERLAIYKLNDHLPYKRKTVKDGVTYNVGDERGQVRYWTSRTQSDFDAMIRDLGYICRQIVGPHYGTRGLVKGGSFPRIPINFGGMQTCQMCPFQQECLADRNQNDIKIENIETLLTDEDFAHETV